jgi:glycerol-3-phosphate dehydrogenase
MTEFSWCQRKETLARLARETFDLLIIGGGITGAGLALDAAARGLRVALVEKRDFAAGTSSRSTKLIHGGLRYLEHYDFALVREGLRERALLVRLAPHLVEPFPFLVPIYQQSGRNYDHPLKMRAGMILYDLLAGRYNLGHHRRLSRDEALKIAPQLDARGLRGAFVYYDCRTDDARLVIEVLKTAHTHGAVAANYTRVADFTKDESGQVAGAHLRDELSGDELIARARIVINATGVWLEETLSLGAQASRPPGFDRECLLVNAHPLTEAVAPALPGVRPSKGIHLTVPADRLRVDAAWLIPSLTGHRFYFVVPWQGRVNIGTTDTDYLGDKDAPRAEADEVSEILGAINSYFPAAQLEPSDVITSWAGLRPLVSDPMIKSTTAVSRKEELLESGDGMISLAGGKLTTYRLMAERGIDLAARRLRERFNVNANGSRTSDIVIGGGALERHEIETLARRLAQDEGFTFETAQHLVTAYGTEAPRVASIAREDKRWGAALISGLPHLAAEIIYAARHEMAVAIADALARRTRLLMLAGKAAVACAPMVAELMAGELGWNEEEIRRQIAQLTDEYTREYSAPLF